MTWRAAIGRIHLYLGLCSCAVVTFVGLTGSLIVFEEELDRLINPSFFAVREVRSEERQVFSLAEAAKRIESIRSGLRVERIDLRHLPRGPVLVKARDVHASGMFASEREFSVDTRARRVIGERSAMNPVAIIWRLHVDLMLGPPGRTVLGISAVVLTVSVLSGLVLWWPRRGKIGRAFTIKRPAGTHRRNLDVHRVTGIYLFVPLFVASFTGVVIIWPQYTFPALELFLDIPEHPRPEPRAIDPVRDVGIDAAVGIARSHVPVGRLRVIHLPSAELPFYLVAIRSFENGHPRGRSYVYLYPDTGEVHFWEQTRGNTLGYQIRWEWLLPTHSGDILGIPGKIAMLSAGLAPLVFTITGLVIWRNKRRARSAARRRRAGSDRTLRPAQ